MASRRATALVAVVVALAITQILVEDVIVYLGATGAVGPAVLSSPYLLVGLPFAIFLLLAGVVWAWALSGEDPRV